MKAFFCFGKNGFCFETDLMCYACKHCNNEGGEERECEVAEVKHGYNATDMHPVDEFVCSVCGFTCTDFTERVYDEDGEYTYYRECEFDYCPKCGAKMDKEKE